MEINYQQIVNTYAYQFNVLLQNKNKSYFGKQVILGNEQYFNETPLEENEIGIVVHFGSATIDFNQAEIPVTMETIGLPNEIDSTQQLLTDFALAYNNTKTETFRQFYVSPTRVQNFVQYGDEFRTLWSMDCAVILLDESVLTKVEYFNSITGKFEVVESLKTVYDFSNQPSPQPMQNTDGRNITTLRTQTFSLGLSVYESDTQLLKDCIENNLGNFNNDFKFRITFGKMNHVIEIDLKQTQYNVEEVLGKNGIVGLTFCR